MAKFCSKCGKPLQEGAKFCPVCGAPVQPVQGVGSPYSGPDQGNGYQGAQTVNNQGQPMGNMSKKMLIPLVIGAVVVVILAVTLAVKIFGGGYKKPIKNLEKGLNTQNTELLDEAYVGGFSMSGMEYAFNEMGAYDYEFDFDIVGKEKLDKDEMEDILVKDYYVAEKYARAADAAYILDVEMSVEVEETDDMDEIDESQNVEIPVIKIDGEWKIPQNFMGF